MNPEPELSDKSLKLLSLSIPLRWEAHHYSYYWADVPGTFAKDDILEQLKRDFQFPLNGVECSNYENLLLLDAFNRRFRIRVGFY